MIKTLKKLFNKPHLASLEIVGKANGVHIAYKKANNPEVNKDKILLIISAFEELYSNKTSETHDNYYIGNLIGTGKSEGTYEQVVGSVTEAINRTKKFIENSDKIHSSQCEYFARNLLVILEKESFKQPVNTILMPYLSTISDIENGFL